MKIYEVGGCVRDELLGLKSKDIDFTFIFDDDEAESILQYGGDPFLAMTNRLKMMGFNIFLESPEYLTIRAQFPRYSDGSGFVMKQEYSKMTADFVLARKESDYTDGRRPDVVTPGTLEDDLARRDFTMNAVARDSDGSYIDPFNGRADIDAGVIRAVGNPLDRLTEDALRAVRAIRFSVTKIRETQDGYTSFSIDPDLASAMEHSDVLRGVENVADDRIRAELSKMFQFDTVGSLIALSKFDLLTDAMFSGTVSLDATMKTKGRGK